MFPYFSHERIRRGCYPWKMIHSDSDKAIVLIHGLSDSPYYMQALARFFHQELSYSVFIPLLHCHGLRKPEGMDGVSRTEWKKNVAMSVRAAAEHGKVSIGGLSTGATLGIYAVEELEYIDGCLYMFSAALAFAGGFIGRFKQWIVRTWVADLLRYLDRKKNLIGSHPYRYAYVDRGAARELSLLIEEISQIIAGYSKLNPFNHLVFAVHHQNDEVVSIAAVKDFISLIAEEMYEFLVISEQIDVAHAGVILQNDIYSPLDDKKVLERSNPQFHRILEGIVRMDQRISPS